MLRISCTDNQLILDLISINDFKFYFNLINYQINNSFNDENISIDLIKFI